MTRFRSRSFNSKSQPPSSGFLPATASFSRGGAGLAAQRLTHRQTQDLDFFTSPGRGEVPAARDEFLAVASERLWSIEIVQNSSTFCRLLITGPEQLLVDLALDSTPGHPAAASIAGPTLAPEELAGRKMIALFDRAAARDFLDVYALSHHYDKAALLDLAAEIDAGFDQKIFATMLHHLDRYSDADLALGKTGISVLRAFFASWASELCP